VVVEQVFTVPGLGGLIVGSIIARDYLVVQAIAMLMAIGILVRNFFSISPRRRSTAGEAMSIAQSMTPRSGALHYGLLISRPG